jgi:hypothetical protein
MLESCPYARGLLAQARRVTSENDRDWQVRTRAALDGVLSPGHRDLLSPVFAPAEPRDGGHDPRLWQERLNELAGGRYHWVNSWLRACALHALDPSAPNAARTLDAAAGDRDPLVAETARGVLGASGRDGGGRASTIERVLVLEKVSIFESIPHELLADAASLLTERQVAPGERVISKGGPGDSLYIVVAGRVRVHDGERTIREMAANEFFGELSLLDSEPRAASVTAIEPTLLFRLAQDDFYVLLREQPEISRAINRALCRLIRNA